MKVIIATLLGIGLFFIIIKISYEMKECNCPIQKNINKNNDQENKFLLDKQFDKMFLDSDVNIEYRGDDKTKDFNIDKLKNMNISS